MDYSSVTDENLISIGKTAEGATEELISRYKGMVISLARKYFLQGGELEDLISEGMIGLYRAIMTFEEGRKVSFSTYSYLCISRSLINAIKNSLSNKNIVLNKSVPLNEQEKTSGGVDPEEIFILKEQEEKLMEILKENLSSFEFSVLFEYMKGLSYDEMKDKLGCDKKRIDNALSRSKKKLSSIIRR